MTDHEPKKHLINGQQMTGDDYFDLPFSERARYWLSQTRIVAGYLGYWRSCPLPACRRAKACRGEVRPERVTIERNFGFPPCSHEEDDRKSELISTWQMLLDVKKSREARNKDV